jgi:hypothetical protein
MSLAHTPYVETTYGIVATQAAATPIEVQEIYAKILLVIAGADGLSGPERVYFEEWLRETAHPPSLARQLMMFDPRHADVGEMLGHFKVLLARTVDPLLARILVRAVVYDGARVASVRGEYSAAERAQLREVGKILGLDDTTIDSIEAQIEVEAAARDVSRALGHSAGAQAAQLDAAVRKARLSLFRGVASA